MTTTVPSAGSAQTTLADAIDAGEGDLRTPEAIMYVGCMEAAALLRRTFLAALAAASHAVAGNGLALDMGPADWKSATKITKAGKVLADVIAEIDQRQNDSLTEMQQTYNDMVNGAPYQ